MAFAISKKKSGVKGDLRYEIGVYTNSGGGTGGNIAHGMQTVYQATLQPKGSAVAGNAPVVNETLPLANNTPITIVTDADEVGTYEIQGE